MDAGDELDQRLVGVVEAAGPHSLVEHFATATLDEVEHRQRQAIQLGPERASQRSQRGGGRHAQRRQALGDREPPLERRGGRPSRQPFDEHARPAAHVGHEGLRHEPARSRSASSRIQAVVAPQQGLDAFHPREHSRARVPADAAQRKD